MRDNPGANDRQDDDEDARDRDDRERYDRDDDDDDDRNERRRDDRGWFDDRRFDGARQRDNGFDNGFEEIEPKQDDQRITFDGGARPHIAPLAPPKVGFISSYQPGSIVIDTGRRTLYYVVSANAAYQYPISVGKQGFSWTGTEAVSRIAEWPDWYPPAEMRERRPDLPEKMTGGLKNPLGASAIYLGNTLYRIHGTNDPKSIGRAESSGCIRMLNAHAIHLASLVHVGTPVTVVPSLAKNIVSAQ